MIHLVQYHPAIPQNTGNIARTAVGLGAHLHLIHPMKFEISDHAVQRAGLDHWPLVELTQHADDTAFLGWLDRHGRRPWLITKHTAGSHRIDTVPFAAGDVLLLGNENTGLPAAWHQRWPDRRTHIPMPGPAHGRGNIRSFNVANCAAIALCQAHLRIHPAAPDT